MRSIRTILAALILLPLALSGQSSAGENQGRQQVVLYRGNTSTHPSPVAVYRGSAEAPAYLSAPAARPAPAPATIMTAGRRIWLVDPTTDRLSVCELRRTSTIGRSRIACTERALPAN